MPKSIEEAANAVDDMFNTAMQTAGRRFFIIFFLFHLFIEVGQVAPEGESGDESEDEDDDADARSPEEEEDGDDGSTVGQGSTVNTANICIVQILTPNRQMIALLPQNRWSFCPHRKILALRRKQKPTSPRSLLRL